jgi:hypothetical protein
MVIAEDPGSVILKTLTINGAKRRPLHAVVGRYPWWPLL